MMACGTDLFLYKRYFLTGLLRYLAGYPFESRQGNLRLCDASALSLTEIGQKIQKKNNYAKYHRIIEP